MFELLVPYRKDFGRIRLSGLFGGSVSLGEDLKFQKHISFLVLNINKSLLFCLSHPVFLRLSLFPSVSISVCFYFWFSFSTSSSSASSSSFSFFLFLSFPASHLWIRYMISASFPMFYGFLSAPMLPIRKGRD